ncbi:MAG TPA: adenylate kinase [Acidimicrobiales bacterium]|nr:adenylate kinase [Acidimicrobiales bacterium]
MIPGIRLIVLGKQGAGKGTQGVRLSHHFVVPHISTGDIFRAATRQESDLGRKLREYMEAGELVPDDIVLQVVAERLDQDDTRTRGFVLDGFPRTTEQAQGLTDLLGPKEVDLAVDLEVPTAVVLHRLASRRACADCGANYSVERPPAINWTCDICGGEVVQRADDTEAAIRHRLELYEEQTAPLIDWYMARGKLLVVNGMGSPDEVMGRLVRAIERRRAP